MVYSIRFSFVRITAPPGVGGKQVALSSHVVVKPASPYGRPVSLVRRIAANSDHNSQLPSRKIVLTVLTLFFPDPFFSRKRSPRQLLMTNGALTPVRSLSDSRPQHRLPMGGQARSCRPGTPGCEATRTGKVIVALHLNKIPPCQGAAR